MVATLEIPSEEKLSKGIRKEFKLSRSKNRPIKQNLVLFTVIQSQYQKPSQSETNANSQTTT